MDGNTTYDHSSIYNILGNKGSLVRQRNL